MANALAPVQLLAGRVAVVTGAGSGIGAATARVFAEHGAIVVVAELRDDWGEQCAAAIRASGGTATFIRTDVTDARSVAATFEHIQAQFGRVDVLHNCAGGSNQDDGRVDELDLDLLDRTLSLNLRSAMLCSQAALPAMIEGGGGNIINMSSTVALRGRERLHAYTAAKGAVVSLTRAMAAAYSEHNVRTNAICPGAVMTERVRELSVSPNEWFGAYPFATGEPEDIARIALFLASDWSRMINGHILAADGGVSSY